MSGAVTGGCQCGAVRYRVGRLGRSSVCHCRMCQKATGNVFGIFVTAHGLAWTRGAPARFRSSDLGERLFCAACGTPLAVDETNGNLELAIGALDDPAQARPTVQLHLEGWADFFAELAGLPVPADYDPARIAQQDARLRARQHPDHDTQTWPPAEGTAP